MSVSVSQRQRRLQNFEIDATGSNLLSLPPLTDARGRTVDTDFVLDRLDDPGSSFDFVTGGFFPLDVMTFEEHTYEVQRQRRDTLSVSVALQWQISARTNILLGGRYNRQEARATENAIAFDNDDGDWELVDGVLRTVFEDPEIDFESQIEDEELINAGVYVKGISEYGPLSLEYVVSYARAEDSAPETEIDFDTGSLLDEDKIRFVPFTFDHRYFPVPNAGVTSDPDFRRAIGDIPATQLLDDFSAELINRQVNDRYGLQIDAEYVLDAGFIGGVLESVAFGTEVERSQVADDWTRLAYFEPDALNLDGSFDPGYEGTGDGEYLEKFDGLFGGFVDLEPIGNPLRAIGLSGIPVLDEGAFRRLARTFRESFLASGAEPYDVYYFDAEETLFAGYVQAAYQAGRFSAVGGVRVEHYRGEYASPLEFDAFLLTANLADPNDEDSVVTEAIDLASEAARETIRTDASNTEVLPRLNLLYGINDRLQVRAGIGYSLARPSFSQLGNATEIFIALEAEADEIGDTPILAGVNTAAAALSAGGIDLNELTEVDVYVFSGNPDLDNARSLNIDLSFEYYPMRGTSVALAFFHKEIDDFIFIGSESASGGLDLELVDGLLSDEAQSLIEQMGGLDAVIRSNVIDELEILQPRNGSNATASGIELGFNHQLTWAPGWLSDVGLSASLAYTRSDAEIALLEPATPGNPSGGLDEVDALVALGFAEYGDGVIRSTDFFNSPRWSGNAVVYHESETLEIALSYHYQSSAFDSLDDFGLDQYSGRYSQLDFYLEYELPLDYGRGDFSAYLEIPDITDSGRNPTDLQSLGRTRRVIDEASFNGREFRIGVRARF